MIRSEGRARCACGAAAVAALASRLTERDRRIALACYEHRVLTTEQLRRLHFGLPGGRGGSSACTSCACSTASDHPGSGPGQRSPYHWTARRGRRPHRRRRARRRARASSLAPPGRRRDRRLEQARPPARGQRVLHPPRRGGGQAGGRLAAWWGERRCLAALGGQAAPDGYGRLELPGQGPVSFLLELDRGTEAARAAAPEGAPLRCALPAARSPRKRPLILLAVPTAARARRAAQALAASSAPIAVV